MDDALCNQNTVAITFFTDLEDLNFLGGGEIWYVCLTATLFFASSLSADHEPDKRFLLDTISHAVDTVGHVLTDTVNGVGSALGNAAGTVLGAAGGLAAGLVTTGADLLIHKVDFMSKAAIDVLNGGLDFANGVVHGVSDIIDGILGHCFFFCSHHHHGQPVHPNIQCPANVNVTSDSRSTSKVVKLANPTYSDPKGYSVKITVQNLPKHNIFQEGSTIVRYTATNSHGLSSSCHVTVTVNVPRCDKPSYLENGRVSCTSKGGYMLSGETCSFTCESGYWRSGPATVTCTESNRHSFAPTVCQAVSCGATPVVAGGQYQCPLGQVFQSTCHLTCPQGYSPGFRFYITCQASGKWTDPGQCVATSPPRFLYTNCTGDVTYTPIGGSSNAKVTWDQVQVDQSKGVGHVTVTQTVGPLPGSVIGPGRQTVEYEAQDQTGNKATCYFTVDASRAVRPCNPPSYKFKDASLEFQCPSGYSVGSTCKVRCKPGYHWSHQGPSQDFSTIQCSLDQREPTGVNWVSSSSLPVCSSRTCPALSPPDNGALSCDKWVSGNMCQMQCQNGFVLPLSAPPNGMYACGQTGSWRPNGYVLPCVASTLPLSFRAPGNMYYSGPCPTSATARSQISSNFVKTLSSSIFMSACADKSQCRAQNVDVICGKVTGKRQATFSVEMKFDVVVPYSKASGGGMAAEMAAQNTLTKIASGITNAVKAGQFSFSASGLTAVSGILHVDAIIMDCPPGTAADYTSGACAGCPKGQYYNSTTNTCADVPKGFYQTVDNAVTYTPCPTGMSTASQGAKNVSECQELCPPGQYSPTGLAPCSLCEKGSYSALPGQVKCSSCAVGYSTLDLASTRADTCMDYSLLYSQCQSSPCLNRGMCEEGGQDGYQCRCRDGYTGRRCELSPSPCISQPCDNGGTCVTTNASYTCICPLGYAGTDCELKLVNGGWGGWSVWSECSATCGQNGRRSRSRRCDSPVPKNGGTDCQGDITQTAPCNQHECPKCPTFPKPQNTVTHCTTQGGTHTCNMTCVSGYSFTNDPLPLYECGPGTGFEWNYQTKTSGYLPSCTEMATPKSLNVKSTMSFAGLKCSLVDSNALYHKDLTSQIEQHSGKLACKDGGFCSSHTEVKCSAPDSNAVVELTLTAPGISTNLDLKEYFQNKQVSPDLANYLQTLLAMELTGSQLENHTSSILPVTINNIQYTPVSKGVVSGVECQSGSVYRGSTCLRCGPGSKQVGNDCHLCEINTYQPLEGQDQCQNCPPGRGTLQTGSRSVSECEIVSASQQTTVNYIMVTPFPIQFITDVVQIGKKR